MKEFNCLLKCIFVGVPAEVEVLKEVEVAVKTEAQMEISAGD